MFLTGSSTRVNRRVRSYLLRLSLLLRTRITFLAATEPNLVQYFACSTDHSAQAHSARPLFLFLFLCEEVSVFRRLVWQSCSSINHRVPSTRFEVEMPYVHFLDLLASLFSSLQLSVSVSRVPVEHSPHRLMITDGQVLHAGVLQRHDVPVLPVQHPVAPRGLARFVAPTTFGQESTCRSEETSRCRPRLRSTCRRTCRTTH